MGLEIFVNVYLICYRDLFQISLELNKVRVPEIYRLHTPEKIN